MTFDFDAIRDIVCCPKCHSPLIHQGESLICTAASCRLKYPIRDEIPILLLDEAEELSAADWEDLMQHSEQPAAE